jgi:hypothetical protein
MFLNYAAKCITIPSILEILAILSSSVLWLSVCTLFPPEDGASERQKEWQCN